MRARRSVEGFLPRLLILFAAILLAAGCGSDAEDDPQRMPTPEDETRAQNEAAIEAASQAPDALAEEGAPKVRRTLRRQLGMNRDGEFRLNPDQPSECERDAARQSKELGVEIECVGEEFDCYVKTGAEAVAFGHRQQNVLYAPNGRDLVFVQTFQGIPLNRCLTAVRDALDW